jgi:hypothetical protein
LVRVPGFRTEVYCPACEVRTEFIYAMLYVCYVEENGRWVGIVCSRSKATGLVSYVEESRPPLWSGGHSSWLRMQNSWVRFPALPDFLRSIGSGTWSTQPLEYN